MCLITASLYYKLKSASGFDTKGTVPASWGHKQRLLIRQLKSCSASRSASTHTLEGYHTKIIAANSRIISWPNGLLRAWQRLPARMQYHNPLHAGGGRNR